MVTKLLSHVHSHSLCTSPLFTAASSPCQYEYNPSLAKVTNKLLNLNLTSPKRTAAVRAHQSFANNGGVFGNECTSQTGSKRPRVPVNFEVNRYTCITVA